MGKGFFGLLMMRSITALAPLNPETMFDDGFLWVMIFFGVGAGMMVCCTGSNRAPPPENSGAPRMASARL